MIEEEPPDTIEQQGPVGGGILNSKFSTTPVSEFLTLLQLSNEARIPYQISRITNTKHLMLLEIR